MAANPTPSAAGSAAAPKKPGKGQIWVAVLGSLFIISLMNFSSGSDKKAEADEKPVKTNVMNRTTSPSPSRKVMGRPGVWSESMTSYDKRVDVSPDVYNVFWVIRLDHDDNRVYHMFPKGWRPGSHLEFGDYNSVEVSIEPNQGVNEISFSWGLSERRVLPST